MYQSVSPPLAQITWDFVLCFVDDAVANSEASCYVVISLT
jgi:hypothetical protein